MDMESVEVLPIELELKEISNNVGFINNDSKEDKCSDYYNCEEISSDEEIIEENSDKVLCFETDHAALKGNSDYHALIKALSILQVQRIKTIKDIEQLEQLKYKIRQNPREYLDKFKRGETSDIPSHIEVYQVPIINWSKYNTSNNGADALHNQTSCEADSVCRKKDNVEDSSDNALIVRGRVFDQSKPQTFNQLWTAEEQLRLEELLLEYPPERNENNRWRLIAQALGNRTTKQVCSRVQKYFKKLSKAGLPIPGHQLKSNTMPSLRKKHRKTKKCAPRDSTFFPTHHLGAPQLLDDCEDDENKIRTPALTAELKIEIMNKVTEFQTKDAQLSPYYHSEIKCTLCGQYPICGTRWKCLVCDNVDMCSNCVLNQLSVKHVQHPPSHPLEALGNPKVAFWDPDYTPHSFKSSNYLDPNYVSSNIL